MADSLPQLEQKLKALVEQRDATRALISNINEDLKHLFAKNPKRPRGSMVEIEQNLEDLEKQRVRTSLTLTEEKKLLKQIHAGERDKRLLEERMNHDKKIDLKKAQVQEMRNALKPLSDTIAEVEKAISKAKLAEKLGCKVEELETSELECPADKMGKVIGKSGATIQKIEETANVSIDINGDKHTITIIGSQAAFCRAKEEIEKIVQETTEAMDISEHMDLYLTASSSTVLDDLRKEHPNVYMDVGRGSKIFRMCGMPDELAQIKQSLANLGVVKKERELTPAEAVLVIGRKGVTIEQITTKCKAAIEVDKKSDEMSLATVVGPENEVVAAMQEIEDLISANKEVTKTIPCSKTVVQAFLTANGVRVKELQKKINESTREQNAGTVSLTFDKPNSDTPSLIIKAKSAAIGTAVAMAGEEIRNIDTSTVRIMADTHAIPSIIGKGGENIRKLKEGKKINIEVDKVSGEVAINGLNADEVKEAEAQVLEIINENKVLKIPVDAALIDTQYRELVRSKARTEITELARLDVDKKANTILLRGTDENVNKAAEIVKKFLENNYTESIDITDADRDVLLAGAKNSKIVNFAKELEVNLSAGRGTSAIQVRGSMDKVKAAVKILKAYLFGGEGNECFKIPVAEEAIGLVIGKGGKGRKNLETKYPGCSIYIHRSNDAITIRGPEEHATNLRLEVLKIISSGRITQTVKATEEQVKQLKKSNLHRRLTQNIPVQCTLEETAVSVRGVAPDVKDAVALLKEHLTGVYEAHMEMGAALFAKLKAANRDKSHFARINESSGAEVSLEESKNAVVVRGTKNNVKKAKLQVLDFLAFLTPGEFGKIKVPKAMQATAGQATGLIEIATTTGATVTLDRDLNMILIQSSDKDHVTEATKLVNAKVKEAEKLVSVFELNTSDAWLIPMIIGKNGSHVNSIRKESGCTIDVSKEERTVVVSGSDEESVLKAKTTIETFVEKAKKENVFVDVPLDSMARFVGKGGAHISQLRNEYVVEIETSKNSSKVRISGDEQGVQACKDAIAEWVKEWGQPQAKLDIQIQRHHIAPILGLKGANIQAMQEDFGCRIDLDRENLLVSFRGAPTNQEIAFKKIEEIIAENPAPERPVKNKEEGEEDENKEQVAKKESSKMVEDAKKKEPEMTDPDEQIDRTHEFPSLPIGIAPPKRSRRKRKTNAATKVGPSSPARSFGSRSSEDNSESDEEHKIVARDPTSDPVFLNAIATA